MATAALFNFTPEWCPNCGSPLGMFGFNFRDYREGSPFLCNCGLLFQFKPELEILNKDGEPIREEEVNK